MHGQSVHMEWVFNSFLRAWEISPHSPPFGLLFRQAGITRIFGNLLPGKFPDNSAFTARLHRILFLKIFFLFFLVHVIVWIIFLHPNWGF